MLPSSEAPETIAKIADAGEVVILRRERILLPPNRPENRRLGILAADWARLKRLALKLKADAESGSDLVAWYSILFGVAASTGPSIWPIAVTQGLPAWVLPLYICVFLASVLLGYVLVRLKRRYCKDRASAAADLVQDMEAVEGTLQS